MHRLRTLAVVLLFVACGSRAPQDVATTGQASNSAPVGSAATSSQPPAVAYVVSADVRTDNVPVYLRLPGAGVDVHVTDAMVASGIAPNVLLVTRRDGHVLAYRLGDTASLIDDRLARDGRADGVIVGSTLYEYSGDWATSIDSAGTARSVTLPAALPTTVGPCELTKAIYDFKASSLNAIASVQGHPYAYVATLGNGAVIDLDGGRRLDLPDAGRALAMATGSDGKLYALTIDGRCATNHLVVRRFDVASLRQEAAIDTGRTLPVSSASLVTAGDATYVHLVTEAQAELLRVSVGNVASIAVPPDSGFVATGAPDGTIYLYGARARNIISRFDPRSGTTAALDGLSGPRGSFIAAVFFGP